MPNSTVLDGPIRRGGRRKRILTAFKRRGNGKPGELQTAGGQVK